MTKTTEKVKKSDKYLFTLTGINTERIHQKYGITIDSNISFQIEPINTTKIADLMGEKFTPSIISFLDESKHIRKCNVSTNTPWIINHYNCFWCRNPFDSHPIGCPVNYTPRKAVKTYFSEISKDVYTIKENITSDRISKIGDDIVLMDKDKYETDCIFCSWNCMTAFILENKHQPLYNKSSVLMYKMYKDIMGQDPPTQILPAPHWRCLKEYGGFMDIKTFREGFNKITFEFHGIIKNTISPISYLYEEHVRL